MVPLQHPGAGRRGALPAEPTMLPGPWSSCDGTLVVWEKLGEHRRVSCTKGFTAAAFGTAERVDGFT